MKTPFQPPTGLVSDDTVFAAPGRWKDASGARFYDGNWQTDGGFERLTTDLLAGVCRAVFGWTDAAAILNVAFGSHNALEVWQGGELFDITPLSFVAGAIDGSGGAGYGTGGYGLGEYSEPSTADYFPLTWSLSAFGEVLVANPRGQTIYAWLNDTADKAVDLTNAPAEVTYTICVPQRQVMALGCNEEVSGIYNGLCIRWSDIEDGEVWNATTSNNAGEYILEGGGRIVTGRVIGDYVFVWTDVALYLGTFIGAPEQTWTFSRVGQNCGAIGPGSPVIVGQTAFWISPDAQFWSCALGGAPFPVDCPILKEFADNIALGQQDKIVGASTTHFEEVRWFYPDMRDGFENSRDIRICLAAAPGENWNRGQLPRTAYVDAGPHVSPIGCTYAGNAYWQERGTSADGGVLSGFIESTDFYLDNAENALTINGTWPNFKDQTGALSLTLYVREYPQSQERTKGPYVLTAGLPKKSFRVSGRVVRVRYSWSSSPAYVRGGRQEFDVEPIGGR